MILVPILIAVSQAIAPPSAPTIKVPAGQHPVLTAVGRGVQIYRCTLVSADVAPRWVLVAPQAQLLVDNKQVGTHDAGPSWHLQDGSTVLGVALANEPSTSPDSIPQLLLQAKKTEGKGLLTTVTYIRRTQTNGGLAPQDGCDAGHIDATVRAAYQATYTFYSAD